MKLDMENPTATMKSNESPSTNVTEARAQLPAKVVKIEDVSKLSEVLEDVDTEDDKLILDLRSIPEFDMQVYDRDSIYEIFVMVLTKLWTHGCAIKLCLVY